MNVIALSTARKGSKSVHNKNILPVNGTPLFLHPIKKALNSKKISSVYCSTNDSKIIDLSEYYDYDIIKRPDELCTDKSKHEDAIVHAINDIECKTGKKLDIVVLLLGNTLGADAIDIDSAIDMIDGYDSVISVNEMNMFNPSRAWKIEDGMCKTIISQDKLKKTPLPNDKNSLGNVYFFNGNFQVLRRDVVISGEGDLPYRWLGRSIRPYIQNEVYMEVDAKWQLEYINNILM
jgi:CMP-N-acetylneuraminic acid synthetase|tara:strand:+ start:2421 stop:3122 length:702 start_codon:yes stop_codon:yes gene_type:complete